MTAQPVNTPDDIPSELQPYVEASHFMIDPAPALPQRFALNTNDIPAVPGKAPVFEAVLRAFAWDNYGMDDVDIALHDDPDAQEWVPELAKKLQEADSELLPIRSGFDMLRQVFESQAYFQGLLGHDYSAMDTAALVEYIKNQVLALLDEGHEALHEVSWKPWAKDTFVHREALAGELVDILCFLVNLALAAGLSPDDFYRLHQEKALRNIKRQEQAGGYSVLEGKCPGCGRAIDDLRAKSLPVGTLGGVDYCSPECIRKKNPTIPNPLVRWTNGSSSNPYTNKDA